MGIKTKLIPCAAAVMAAIIAAWPTDEIKISNKAVNALLDTEGCSLTPYKCSAGKNTNGVGNTFNVKPNKKITEEEAAEQFKINIIRFQQGVEKAIDVPMSQGVYDSLVMFSYNLGLGNFNRSTLKKQINNGDFDKAKNQFQRWKYSRDHNSVLKDCSIRSNNCYGVYKKRLKERDFFIKGMNQKDYVQDDYQ